MRTFKEKVEEAKTEKELDNILSSLYYRYDEGFGDDQKNKDYIKMCEEKLNAMRETKEANK